MKNTINLLILLQFILGIAYGQDYRSDVCTPKGTTVIAYITSENSNYWRNYYDAYYANAYPNAVQIETYDGYSSTRRFNCHGYAWHISDGGSDRWIGYGYPYDNDPEYTYWQDGSYVEVAQSVYPGKVNWSSGDHSAITTENPGVLISKWNEYPLMRHAWDDSPYGTSNLKYYKLSFSISGSGLVCNSGTNYSLSSTPGGTANWTKSSYLSFVGDDTGTSVTVKTISSTTSGNGELHANFTSGCGTSFTVNKSVWAGPPGDWGLDITNSDYYGQDVLIVGDYNVLVVERSESMVNAQIEDYDWDYSSGWSHWENLSDDSESEVYVPSCSYETILVRAENLCGESFWHYETFECEYSYYLALSPNPSTSETIVSLESTDEAKSLNATMGEWDLEVYDQNQKMKAKKDKVRGKSTRLNILGWKEGVYIVRAKYKDQVLTEKLVVKE